MAGAAALPPGPRHPRVIQAVLWALRYPEFTRRAHRRHGSTFTVRPGTFPASVLTTDADAVRRLLTGDPLAKRHANEVVRPLVDDGAVILLDGEAHLARRKLLLAPFHGDRVQAYGALMRELTEAEIARWAPGQSVPVLPVAQNLTIEVILRAVLGVADAATRRRFRRLVDDTLFYPMGARRLALAQRLGGRPAAPARARAGLAFASSLLTPAVMTYFPETKRRAWWMVSTVVWWRHHDRLMALLGEHITATRADPRLQERDDVLAMLVRAGGMNDDELRQELVTLIAAGHETTAAAIAWGAVLLAHDDEVRERAVAAADSGDERWLGALVREVLRLRPPISVAAGRRLDEPFGIDGHVVPPDTPIFVDAWGIHHDPARHDDPEEFRPERFLGDGAEPYAWLPFGGGARRCIGAALAELEVRVALTAMLRAVRLAPAAAALAPPARRGIVMVPAGGGRVRVQPRS